MVPLVLPVGHFAGPMFTSPDAEAPESFEIRFRDGVFSLSAQEYAVWAVAHGDPEKVGANGLHRLGVLEAAKVAGVDQPEPLFEWLLAKRLLVEIAQEARDQVAFAAGHQVFPLALGLGNSPGKLGAFQIGMPNAPRATVGYDIYHLWLFAHRQQTLWHSIRTIGREAEEANAEEQASDRQNKVELVSDPLVLLRGLLEALPVLISTSCVYIDKRD